MAEFTQTIAPIPPREKQADGSLQTPSGYVLEDGEHTQVYPKGDLSTGWPILSALGSFWLHQFSDRGQLRSLYKDQSLLAVQNYIHYLETVATTSRFACEVFHRRQWYALVIRENSLDVGPAALLK